MTPRAMSGKSSTEAGHDTRRGFTNSAECRSGPGRETADAPGPENRVRFSGPVTNVDDMDVVFTRTGQRRYAVRVRPAGRADWLMMEPAPGYDPDLPHDLVHYLVERELALRLGIFGRLAAGGGTFHHPDPADRRRRARREASLRAAGHDDMSRSEAEAGRCAIVWKARRGRLPDWPDWIPPFDPFAHQGDDLERVLAGLDEAAAAWRRLDVGESITLRWPHPPARPVRAAARPKRPARAGRDRRAGSRRSPGSRSGRR
jgi:hypothetical protein